MRSCKSKLSLRTYYSKRTRRFHAALQQLNTEKNKDRILNLSTREAKYAKNHYQQNRYSVFESHVMCKESISTKILRTHGNGEVV